MVLLLGALQLLMLLAGTLTYVEVKLFLLILLNNGTVLISKILIVFKINYVYMYICIYIYIYIYISSLTA
jgi:hypothetical protein